MEPTSEIEQEMVMLGDTEAAKISYTAAVADPLGREVETSFTQYLLLNGARAYFVTLSHAGELPAEQAQAFVEAAESFRISAETAVMPDKPDID